MFLKTHNPRTAIIQSYNHPVLYKTPKDVKDVLYNAFIRSNPIEVSKLMNELKARDVFEHKEYYSRLKSSIRKIQKDEIVENDLMDELNKKVEEIYLELI